ncbi:MAG: flagellar biosynthesis protein FlhB [Firmicutes bacterium]|nr:flagellar biosynthesis protein FlhB [Bacillota bacterium]
MDRRELADLKAVALRYREKEDYAPVVLAKGRGHLAEAILALARQAGVPVMEEPELLEILEKVEVGEYIPPEAYTLAAEVIAFLMRLEGRLERGED